MRDGTQLHYTKCGKIQFGSRDNTQAEDVLAVERYFGIAGIPYEVRNDIRRAMWYKYLLNVGVNQACTVYETDYGHVTSPGPICDEMKEAMPEVCRIAAMESITLTEDDINAAIELEKTPQARRLSVHAPGCASRQADRSRPLCGNRHRDGQKIWDSYAGESEV